MTISRRVLIVLLAALVGVGGIAAVRFGYDVYQVTSGKKVLNDPDLSAAGIL